MAWVGKYYQPFPNPSQARFLTSSFSPLHPSLTSLLNDVPGDRSLPFAHQSHPPYSGGKCSLPKGKSPVQLHMAVPETLQLQSFKNVFWGGFSRSDWQTPYFCKCQAQWLDCRAGPFPDCGESVLERNSVSPSSFSLAPLSHHALSTTSKKQVWPSLSFFLFLIYTIFRSCCWGKGSRALGSGRFGLALWDE